MKTCALFAALSTLGGCARAEGLPADSDVVVEGSPADVVALPDARTVGAAFPPPAGADWVAGDAFGESLRALPLAAPEVPVTTWDGRVVRRDARVIEIPLVRGDLQQCADSVVRVRAEWLKKEGLPVQFHATSGDRLDWERWSHGERPVEVGGRLQWRAAGGAADWDGYLRALFNWGGSWSLEKLDSAQATSPEAGMILVHGGFPGHAVLLLGVAKREDETFVLVGQGFMPAQSFHVDPGPFGGWWRWEDPLALSVWTFSTSELRRFR